MDIGRLRNWEKVVKKPVGPGMEKSRKLGNEKAKKQIAKARNNTRRTYQKVWKQGIKRI